MSVCYVTMFLVVRLSIGILGAGLSLLAMSCYPGYNYNSGTRYPSTPLADTPTVEAVSPSDVAGIWQTTFGITHIELHEPNSEGSPRGIRGFWKYNTKGSSSGKIVGRNLDNGPHSNSMVTGYFEGKLSGARLDFRWSQTSSNDKAMAGYGQVVFQTSTSFSGTWVSENNEMSGTWSGTRQQ